MSDKLKAIFKGIGLPETILTEVDKDDFDPKKVVADFNEKQKEHFKPLIENEIRSDIEQEVTEKRDGYWLNTLNNDIKKLGVPIEKIKTLHTHEKLKELVKHIEEKSSKADTSDQIKAIQEENISLKNALSEWENKLQSEVEKVKKEESSKTVSKLVDLDLQKKFTSIPADRILGKKHSDGIFYGLKSYMGAKYDFGIDEKDTIIAYEKGTQKRVQGKNSEGKEYFVPIEDLLLSSLKDLSLTVESNGGEGSGKSAQGQDNKKASPRLQEMMAKISQG